MYVDIDSNKPSFLGRRRNKVLLAIAVFSILFVVIFTTTWLLVKKEDKNNNNKCVLPEVSNNPPAPSPERVVLVSVPLPPTAPSNDTGACTLAINPRGTGCMDPDPESTQSGSFLPDGSHILVSLTFFGAPSPPSPSSIFSGLHIVLIKVDGSAFPNGDAWKCVTCGIPDANAQGLDMSSAYSYPQAFRDGMRALVGNNVIDCSPFLLSDSACTPNVTFMYPIHWSTSADGSGAGGSIRELRLHPDNDYLGFNSMIFSSSSISQFGFIGRLSFNPHPTSGTPLVPRYEITHSTCLYNSDAAWQPFTINPSNSSEILFDPLAPSIGEFRGWSRDGQDALWIGLPCESGNFDIMASSLATGATRRLTSNPGYTDPVDMSPDDEWTVVMDTRATDRETFAAGMRGVPPLIDLATTSLVASIRNNGDRRFFQPYLIDKYGDRGAYQGQLLTAEGDGSPGSINDPYWNGRADPRWAPNGTSVVFWQAFVVPPACGGVNPLPCLNSTEPGQRGSRIFIAKFPDRKAVSPLPIPPIPSTIPWGTPFVPGSPLPSRASLPSGNFTLKGKKSGFALVSLSVSPSVVSVSASYSDYSDDGYFVIDGSESATRTSNSPLVVEVLWHSSLSLSGCETAQKTTSENGYWAKIDVLNPVVESTGNLSTTIGGITYTSPSPGT